MQSKGKVIVTGQGEKLRQILKKELQKKQTYNRNDRQKRVRSIHNYSQEHELEPRDMMQSKELESIPYITKTEPVEIKDPTGMDAKGAAFLENYPPSPVSNRKMIIYSKQRHRINDSPAYTISNTEEPLPSADFMFNLKVRVPKVKVSSYFQPHYENSASKFIKPNNSQFMSNSVMTSGSRVLDNSEAPESPKVNRSAVKTNASLDGGISSRVMNNIQKTSILSNYKKLNKKNISQPLKFIAGGIRNNSVHRLMSDSSISQSEFTPKKNMTSNTSLTSLKSKPPPSSNQIQKLYSGNEKIQKMRLKIVSKIREKAELLREKNNLNFEKNVRNFDKTAERNIQEIFRDTRYGDRKKKRLGDWKNKKYKVVKY